jgi:PKD repeat protein
MDADKTCEAIFAFNPGGDAPPTASFSYSCTGLNCSFDGSTSGDDKGIVEYYWNFGDGVTASGTDPTADHTYTTARTYPVTLKVTDTASPSQTNTATASVRAKDKGKTKGSSGGDDGGSGSGNCPPAKAAKGKC